MAVGAVHARLLAVVLLLLCPRRHNVYAASRLLSALEAQHLHEELMHQYNLDPESCKAANGMPLVIGLMREASEERERLLRRGEEEVVGWGTAYYTMSYRNPGSGPPTLTKIEVGTFVSKSSSSSTPAAAAAANPRLQDSVTTKATCLRRDMQYEFKLSRNPNRFEIGALVGQKDFLGPEDTLHISTAGGKYRSRVRHYQPNEALNQYNWFSHMYYYAPGFRPPTLNPTPYPTWSRPPSANPTTMRQPSEEQLCLQRIPGYTSTYSISSYCSLYSSTACTANLVSAFSCVPSYLKADVGCGATFCNTFAQLASGPCQAPSASAQSLDLVNATMFQTINEACLKTYVAGDYNASDLTFVNWRLSLDIKGVDSSSLNADAKSQAAVRGLISRFVPGVPLSAVTLETIAALAITRAPTKSPSTVRSALQKSSVPTYSANSIMVKPKSAMMADERKYINVTRLRWHSRQPTKRPTVITMFPTLTNRPTTRAQRTRAPSPIPTPNPTPAPTFPIGSKLNATGVSVTMSIVCSLQSLGYSDEQQAFSDAVDGLSSAATSGAMTKVLLAHVNAAGGTAAKYGVILGNSVVLTTLGTLPPASTPASSQSTTVDVGLVAGTAAAAVAGVGGGVAVAYRVLSSSKEVIQVMPLDEVSAALEGISIQSF